MKEKVQFIEPTNVRICVTMNFTTLTEFTSVDINNLFINIS